MGRDGPKFTPPLRPSSMNLSPFQDRAISRSWYRGISQTEATALEESLKQAGGRQKERADCHRSEAPVFAPGDRVWLSTRNLPLRLPCRKLGLRFMGPFIVQRGINEVCYRLQLPLTIILTPHFMCLSSGRW